MKSTGTKNTEQGNKNLLLFLIILTSFINPFMGAAVNIALPDMASELRMNTVVMGWA